MIDTTRLILRDWRDADRAPFTAMSADPEVMRYLAPLQSRAEVDAAFNRYVARTADTFHPWAVERRADDAFLGSCGLNRVDHGASPVNGEVEVGWKFRRDAWGQGFAREAASAALAYGFAAGLSRIVAFTVPQNVASRGLMERLGMTRRPDLDFDHPGLAATDPLRPHIVYAVGHDAAA